MMEGVKPLAPQQQRIWDLCRPIADGGQGKSRKDAAAVLGISVNVVAKALMVIRRKLGIKVVRGEVALLENVNPGKAAALLDALTEPAGLQTLKESFKACGLPESVNSALLRRIKAKYFGAVTEVRALKTGEILDIINKKIHLASIYLDDKALGEASARDLMLGISALVEKRQLLRGEPTQIISDHERKKLHELLPDLMREAQRRGITMEGEVTGKEVGA